MSLKDTLEDDLKIFYNTNEFAITAIHKQNGKSKEIPIILRDNIDIHDINQYVITSLTLNVKDVKEGDKFIFNNKEYKCVNFEHQINLNETIITLSEYE